MDSPNSAYQSVRPAWLLVLVLPLVFFAVRGSFSFDYTSINNPATGNYGALTTVNAGEGSVKHSVELVLAYGTVFVAMFMLLPVMVRAIQNNLLVFALPCYAILSTLWSQEPTRTFAFGILALINTAFGIYLARCLSPRQQLKLFIAAATILGIVSIALVIGMPRAGVDYKNATLGWQGIFPHKNICALVMLSFLPAVLAEPFRGGFAKLLRPLCILLILTLLIGSTSRTGWIVAFITLGGFYALKFLRRVRPIERHFLAFTLLAAAVIGTSLILLNMDQISRMMGKGADLSGRTVIWRVVIQHIINHPWLGSGYDAFWLGLKGDSAVLAIQAGDPGLNNAENGVLQLWLEVGVFGVLLLFLMLFRTCRNALTCYRSDTPAYVLWYITILIITLLSLVDGDKFMFPNAIEWTMYIMADAALAAEAQRVRSRLRAPVHYGQAPAKQVPIPQTW